ncbi:MAG: serine/threonine protein kinase [Planctomycetota bacterium]|nr:MAG: serine/threonine protein kinase [Planctomycetota bacterium]
MHHDNPLDDQTTHDSGKPPGPADETGIPSSVTATTQIAVNRRLGRGGLGDVYSGSDKTTGRSLAVKFLNDWAASQESLRESFQFEATVTSQLEHPNIVPVYVTGATADGRPFYAMRLIPGRTLGAAITDFHDRRRAHDPPSERNTRYRELLGQFALVCKAIAYAHDRGVIHRDIKPANVMLGKFGEVVVLDWGLAARIDRDDRARSSGEQSIVMPTVALDSAPEVKRGISGTPAYMSPEQHDGASPVGLASDVYGLGATLYHLITGQPPFEGDVGAIREKVTAGRVPAPTRVKKGVSRVIEAVCLKAMARDPADRYETPLELAQDVDAYLADNPVSAYRDPPLRRLARWTRRHRTITQVTVGALALLLVAAAATSMILRRVAHDEYRSRQTALRLAARLAASTAALQIDSRWRVLEYEADNNQLVGAMAAVDGTTADPTTGRRQWGAIQAAVDDIAANTKATVDAESWTVCDAKGVQVARSPQADTIGRNFAWRNYFHGGEHDLEPGTAADPITEVHRSTVYRSDSTGKLKVAFSAPIWSDGHGAEHRRVLGVLLMSFDVGLLFRSVDAIGSWNASRAPYSVAVIDLRDDIVDGEPKTGLVLENPEVARTDLSTSADLQLVRAPAEVVARLKQTFHHHPEFGKPARPVTAEDHGGLDAEIIGLFPGTLRQLMGASGKGPEIAAAEPIIILGRPERLADVGWAVLVHER